MILAKLYFFSQIFYFLLGSTQVRNNLLFFFSKDEGPLPPSMSEIISARLLVASLILPDLQYPSIMIE
nr:hypothetical protein Iba_chr04fCG7550 [Ipomoea batatas]GMD61701.1 hypothetical protein Iba_scaffold48851CG0020 [Ipomoea batatas]GME20723.1 hypothetical protein Iba_scaffold25933CG0010 [Ipomoea batatas]